MAEHDSRDSIVNWILGIDGGGTKTTGVLVAEDGTFGAQETAGGSSLTAYGIDRAVETVFDVLKKCCALASCAPDQLAAVGIGLAGAGREVDRTEFHKKFADYSQKNGFPLSQVIVETDWRIALEAAFPTGSGIVVIAGTGSIACARAEDGTFHRVGGEGKLLGDKGSGYAVSLDGLNAAIRSNEGREQKTLLLDYALQHFEVPTVDDLKVKIHREATDIASFGSKILVAARQHDKVALDVLSRGAAELVELVKALITKIQPKRKIAVALMGGLLERENAYSIMLREQLQSSIPNLLILKPKFPAAYGATILALRPFSKQ